MAAAQSLEPGKVAVGGDEFAARFDRQSGPIRVTDQRPLDAVTQIPASAHQRRLGRGSERRIETAVFFCGAERDVILRFKRGDFAHAGEGAADVGYVDGAPDDQGDVEGVDDFLALPALFAAADQMIGDAIVAAQDSGGDEAEEFFGFGVEGTGFVSLMVEGEEALHSEVAAVEDFFVEVGAKFLKVFETIGHTSS